MKRTLLRGTEYCILKFVAYMFLLFQREPDAMPLSTIVPEAITMLGVTFCKGATATMSRWISGRLGRPIAGFISVLMLCSILMPLVTTPVYAQAPAPPTPPDTTTTPPVTPPATPGTSNGDIWDTLSKDTSNAAQPVPIIVLDFYNRSSYHKGMLDRKMAAAISLALQGTNKFSVYPRQDVDSKMEELGLTVPMNDSSQAMLADQLNTPFTVSGNIERVELKTSSEGTYAEIQVSARVISRITRLPINGARIIAVSSPKLAYDGDAEALVEEAISIAGYQLTQRILDNRMPLATVLIAPPDGEIRLRGGTVMGITSGMEMVCVRQESVTGIVRVMVVTPTECTCEIVANYKGIAPGDRAVPHFTLSTTRITPKTKSTLENSLMMAIGAGLLYALIAHSNSLNDAAVVSSSPLGDAAIVTDVAGQPLSAGGNLIRWRDTGRDTMGYILYRQVNGGSMYPIAVLPPAATSFIDGAAVPFSVTVGAVTTTNNVTGFITTYTMTITTTSPTPLLTVNTAVPSATSVVNLSLPLPAAMDTSVTTTGAGATITVVGLNLPLVAGQVVNYRVQRIYWNYVPTTINSSGETIPSTTGMYLGDINTTQAPSIVLAPPVISWPLAGGSLDGLFQCNKVVGGASYVLQISSDQSFTPANTVTVPAAPSKADPTLEEADFTLNQILGAPQLQNATSVFIRMGVNNSIYAAPEPLMPSDNCTNYVFSNFSQFSLARVLAMAGLIRRGMPMLPGGAKSPKGRGGNGLPSEVHRLAIGRGVPQ